ncbi:MAG TPA: 3-keto-5-aminohexanoate cleavage protein [Usitatibacter sp.]|nr:3-keto-5-aminohexanoate cleavage protein [Usitatibacter sp.]
MAEKTFITCAVTGNITRPDQTPHLPITTEQIANECLAAAGEGAAAVHIHVRDPKTGRPSMDVNLYRDVMERIRKRDSQLIINLTTGPGGRFVPSEDDPKQYAPGTTLLPPLERLKHVVELRPDVCSLDLNTMNSGADVVINTPANVRKMAKAMNDAGVLPELEVFDSGDMNLARDLVADGTIKGRGLFTVVMGVKYGFASLPETVFYAKSLLPPGAIWSAFGIGRAEFPMLASLAARRQRARGPRGQHLPVEGRSREEQRGAGGEGAAHARRFGRVGRERRRSPGDAGARETLMPRALNIAAKAPSAAEIQVSLVEFGSNAPSPGDVTIEVRAAGINPSDAKAMLGIMPSAVFPRTPGRDFAGVVIEGPKALVGVEVWGSGGDVGISRNGSHAERLVLPAAAIRAKPRKLSMLEAGTVGVPFVTAYEGFRRAGFPSKGDAVAIFGASGKVGQAAIQIATQHGAKVFAVDRRADAPRGFASGPVVYIDSGAEKPSEVIREETEQKGARFVFNTVGSPYFAEANASLAKRGTQAFIATVDRAVPFDIFTFYRGMHTYVGIDTLALTAVDCAAIFEAMAPGFEDGSLRPFPVSAASTFRLEQAAEAYRKVLSGSPERLAFVPNPS